MKTSRRLLPFLGFYLGLWMSTAATSAVSKAAPPAEQLRRITEPEFQRSLVGGVVRGANPQVRLSHGFAETFLPGGRYRVTSGPLESRGNYVFRSGVLCARTEAEPQRWVCRVILTDGRDRLFARPAHSLDDQLGEGPIAELQMDRPSPSSTP